MLGYGVSSAQSVTQSRADHVTSGGGEWHPGITINVKCARPWSSVPSISASARSMGFTVSVLGATTVIVLLSRSLCASSETPSRSTSDD